MLLEPEDQSVTQLANGDLNGYWEIHGQRVGFRIAKEAMQDDPSSFGPMSNVLREWARAARIELYFAVLRPLTLRETLKLWWVSRSR